MKEYLIIDLLESVISGEWGNEPSGEQDVFVLRTTNFSNNGKIDFSKEVVKRNIDEKKVDAKKLNYGDIIIEKSGGSIDQPVGRVVFYDLRDDTTAYLCNNFTSVLRPNTKLVNPKFLFYFLFYLYKCKAVLKFQNQTTGIINLKLDNYLRNSTISIPMLGKQEHIVKILDKAQYLIEQRKQAIDKLDELVQAVFLDMFGDPVTNSKNLITISLGELGEWKSGGTPSRGNKEYFKGNIPWYTSGELNDLYVNGSIEYITEAAIKETSTKEVPIGALLLGMYDTAALKSSITTKRSSCNQAIAFAKIDEKLAETKYVYYAVQIGKEHYKSIQRGVRQKNLNLSMIKAITILYPSLELQKDFVRIADIIYLKKQQMNIQLQQLESNFQALLPKAFKGELKVKDGVAV